MMLGLLLLETDGEFDFFPIKQFGDKIPYIIIKGISYDIYYHNNIYHVGYTSNNRDGVWIHSAYRDYKKAKDAFKKLDLDTIQFRRDDDFKGFIFNVHKIVRPRFGQNIPEIRYIPVPKYLNMDAADIYNYILQKIKEDSDFADQFKTRKVMREWIAKTELSDVYNAKLYSSSKSEWVIVQTPHIKDRDPNPKYVIMRSNKISDDWIDRHKNIHHTMREPNRVFFDFDEAKRHLQLLTFSSYLNILKKDYPIFEMHFQFRFFSEEYL